MDARRAVGGRDRQRGLPGPVLGGAGWIRIRLEGGCQGCSLAEVTIRQGIETLLRASLPGVTGLVDVTDHEAGTEPSGGYRPGGPAATAEAALLGVPGAPVPG